jgi:hypothetical protein
MRYAVQSRSWDELPLSAASAGPHQRIVRFSRPLGTKLPERADFPYQPEDSTSQTAPGASMPLRPQARLSRLESGSEKNR